MIKHNYLNKLYFILCALFAFFLPVHKHIVPLFFVLLLVNWAIESNNKEKLLFLKSKYLLLFISFYLLYLVGMLWTENQSFGWSDLVEKLSILGFPIIAPQLKKNIEEKSLSKIFISFIAGCFLATLICIVHACYMWHSTSENYFFYAKLSVILHPTYFSMYLLFAIVVLFWEYFIKTDINKRKLIVLLLISWFWFFIILLQSKAGIIIASLVFITFAVILLINHKKIIQIITVLLVLFGGYYIVNRFIITANNSRIYNAEYNILDKKVDTTTTESSQARILVWTASSKIIKNNFLYGVGTGDIKDELDKMYVKMNMTGAHKERLNAHNQYLQSAISLGILGLISIIAIFLFPFIYSIKEKKYIYSFFLIIVGLNIFVESMFETQAGVMFYAFFNILFFIIPKKE